MLLTHVVSHWNGKGFIRIPLCDLKICYGHSCVSGQYTATLLLFATPHKSSLYDSSTVYLSNFLLMETWIFFKNCTVKKILQEMLLDVHVMKIRLLSCVEFLKVELPNQRCAYLTS